MIKKCDDPQDYILNHRKNSAVFSMRLTLIPLGKDRTGSVQISTEIRELALDHIICTSDSSEDEEEMPSTAFLGWSTEDLEALSSRELLGLLSYNCHQHHLFHKLMARGMVENTDVEKWQMKAKNGYLATSDLRLTTAQIDFEEGNDTDCFLRILFEFTNTHYENLPTRRDETPDHSFYSPVVL